MPEITPNTVDNDATQGAPAAPERTFTQTEMDAIIGERLKRERAKYADYESLKSKAEQFDAAQEAAKSDYEKAVEERDKLKAEVERLNAEKERALAIEKAAAEHKVDAALLARMSGDVEENAKFLAEQAANAPKYGHVHDGGESVVQALPKTEIPEII